MLIKDLEMLEEVRRECRSLVTKRALASGGAAAIPSGAPGVAADAALLLEMLPKINRKFGLDPDQIDQLDEQTRQQVFVLVGKLGNVFIGKLVSEPLIVAALKRVGIRVATKSVASWIPLIGTSVAAGISFAMMKAVGNKHIEECYALVKRLLDERGKAVEA